MASKALSLLAMIMLLPTAFAAGRKPVQFPAKGVPYAEARAFLLQQGLVIAPDKVSHPVDGLRECDRGNGRWEGRPYCETLFLETEERGWKNYVVAVVDLDTMTIADVHYPTTAEGLPSIPPPLSANVPQLKGPYLKARKTLRALGFKAAKCKGYSSNTRYTDARTLHEVVLTEAQCSGTGMAFCKAFWIAPDKRVLAVTTIGEVPEVYFVEWSSWKELHDNLDN